MKNLFLSLSILLFGSTLYGQYIQKQANQTYKVDENTYTFNELDQVFARNPQSLLYYTNAISAQSRSKTLGLSTLASLGAGLLFIDSANHNKNIIAGLLDAGAGVVLIGLVTPILGTISLVNLGSAKKHQREAIQSMNEYHLRTTNSSEISLIEYPSSKEFISVRIGGTNSGVGLLFQF